MRETPRLVETERDVISEVALPSSTNAPVPTQPIGQPRFGASDTPNEFLPSFGAKDAARTVTGLQPGAANPAAPGTVPPDAIAAHQRPASR